MAHRNPLDHNPHEDDHSDDEKEDHHHDEHSKHAHKHEELELSNGSRLKMNVFDHYPEHGAAHHTHTVSVPTSTGRVMRTFFHEGAEHKDVPKDHAHAWILNDKKNMKFPLRDAKPLEVVGDHSPKGHDDHSPKAKSAAPAPSAPEPSPHHHSGNDHLPPPPPYEEPRTSGHVSTMYGEGKAARVEKQRQLNERLVQSAATEEQTNCCCVVM